MSVKVILLQVNEVRNKAAVKKQQIADLQKSQVILVIIFQ
jgi:hypothetical protein